MEKLPSLCVFLALLVHCLTLSFVDAGVAKISTDKQALLALKARISHDPSKLWAVIGPQVALFVNGLASGVVSVTIESQL
ncbi:hypothetical protein Pint_11761 [Pistacia integerrima]|uniref:Uncharacterized protein n=1 Tax=Pistacia integerrima TaxID=434235 RepID=A0ACC0XI57_9ROSI|nr:hypothetical protein Pint_11761 [Pistacia integerrima]